MITTNIFIELTNISRFFDINHIKSKIYIYNLKNLPKKIYYHLIQQNKKREDFVYKIFYVNLIE